jgi:hypothetical protein
MMTFDSNGRGHDEHAGLTGHTVVDSTLTKVGTVTDVLFDDDRAGVPRWAVVKTGMLGGEHLVPLDDSYVDAEGRLVVSPVKRSIKRAPKVGRDHVLTSRTRRDLREHYGVAA